MSTDRNRPEERSGEAHLSTSRRTFLAASGIAALGAGSVGNVNALETNDESGPGRIRDLSAYLADPRVFEENREPTHTPTTIPYESVSQAMDSDVPFTELEERFDGSPYFERLDGTWNFAFFERPSALPNSFETFDDWDDISVPRPWQTEGYDERVYTNWQPTWTGYDSALEWDLYPDDDGMVDVPGVGDDGPNPVGVYNRTVSVPENWNGREIFLYFEGVKQAYFVWVDGEYVGFQQGSMTPGEFDITDVVEPGGDHDLTVQIYRWSDGEAMECVDMHKYAGIYRSAYLFSTPPVHIRDFAVRTELDDDYEDATLRVDSELVAYTNADAENTANAEESVGIDESADTGESVDTQAYTIRATLYEPDGRSKTGHWETSTAVTDGGGVATLEAEVTDPAKWSAEDPTLYTLVLELLPAAENGDAEPSEVLLEKVGFRSYEAERGPGGHVTVNGEPVNVRGINRHETDPDTGRTVPLETMREDFELLKQFNLNAVRTSHYPNDPTFYRLADEYGIYVQDEVNCETHWWEGVLSETTAYHDQAVARFRRMILRDRSHASVFSWSTGNEAGTGAEHLNMAALALGGDDPTIPADTESTTRLSGEAVESFDADGIEALAPDRLMSNQPNHGGWDVEYSDMLGPRYIDAETLAKLGAGEDVSDSPRFGDLSSGDGSPGDGERSVVMGEYNHAMGNSLGLIDEMWNDYIQPPVRRVRDRVGDADGVLVGSPTVVAGMDDGGALRLDGNGEYIDIPSIEQMDRRSGVTIEAVVGDVGDIGDDDRMPVISLGRRGEIVVSGDGTVEFTVGHSSATGSIASGEAGLHTLTGVCSDDQLRLYVDGEQIDTADRKRRRFGRSDSSMRVGSDGRSDRFLRGTVERVAVHEGTLSEDEVGAEEPMDDTVLWYDFEDLLRDKSLQGGFIWDWVNQDLNDETDDGEPFQFYHLEGPAGAFCLNGTIWSDRRPQPEMWQLKQCHQPVKVEPRKLSEGELYVTNHHQFTSLDAFEVTWTLSTADTTVREGTLTLETPPSSTEIVSIDGLEHLIWPIPGIEYWLDISVTVPERTSWSDEGHEIAFAQFEIPIDIPDLISNRATDLDKPDRPNEANSQNSVDRQRGPSRPNKPKRSNRLPNSSNRLPPVNAEETNDGIAIIGKEFEYTIDDALGTFTSMRYDGTELITRGPLLNFWRAPIMNELQDWGPHPAPNWYDLGLDDIQYEVDDITMMEERHTPVLEVDGRALGAVDGAPAGFETTYRYHVFGTGAVRVDVEASPTDRLVEDAGEWLPKIGLQLEVPREFDRLEWYGRGPEETYPDRKSGVRVGHYEGSVDDQYVPYLPPQDNGNKADTRWAALSDGTTGLAAAGSSPLNVSVAQYENLAEADYQYELRERDSIGFNLDHAVTGVGGTPVPTPEAYRVEPEETEFSVTVCPFGEHRDLSQVRKRDLSGN
ncbi:hypothetical protein HALLA_03270 (plasmid) [Halostagnicola larsenii XH-48]|uniref:beta-galactosidase n=1 Tax=Halostagnicola larsenii XH-48 TaxID=797299 RepID=W0JRT1_9EURY|nr:glycoside hydrolase family 2 TIM barrel-domain containing protein [Halostagnicola larsenii]AHG01421.1 hypothetical protein HALLA_03270 [Halostagnicola larsenii XH-48]